MIRLKYVERKRELLDSFSSMESSNTVNCNPIKLLKFCLINPAELLKLI